MQISFVNYKTVKENIDFRYEPEFFLPKYIEQEKILSKKNKIILSDCATFSNGRAFDSGEFSFDGDVFISKIGDVTQKRDYKSWKKISLKHFEELNGKHLKHNDILMTLTGDPPDVGKVQLIYNPPKETLSWNQRVALLRLKKQNDIRAPEFLFIVLSSKYCREHIERWAKGIRQRNVGNPAVLDMVIPVFSIEFQSCLAEMTIKSFNLLEKSLELYSQAEQILLSELNLLNWRPKHWLSFVKNYSDTQSAGRCDAEYFQPMYEEIVKKLLKYKNSCGLLIDTVSIKDRKFTPKDEVIYKYIELANISANGNITGFTEALGKGLPTRARRKVNAGDVIVSSIEGSLSSVALINSSLNNALCSTGFYVINSKSINAETLLVFLKSKAGQLQLKKRCSGTILTAIGRDEFEKLIIPKVDEKIQDEIKEKIEEMYRAKMLSNNLLDIAKRSVELAIEKDEKTAEKWIDGELETIGVKPD